MSTKRQKGGRTLSHIAPDFHPKRNQNSWYTIGTAIILISIIVAVIIGMWSVIT